MWAKGKVIPTIRPTLKQWSDAAAYGAAGPVRDAPGSAAAAAAAAPFSHAFVGIEIVSRAGAGVEGFAVRFAHACGNPGQIPLLRKAAQRGQPCFEPGIGLRHMLYLGPASAVFNTA